MRPIPALLLAALASLSALRCAGLTPGEAVALEAGNAVACTGLSLLLPALAAACPGEEALVNGAIEAARIGAGPGGEGDAGVAEAGGGGSAGPTVAAAVFPSASMSRVTLGAPLYHRRGRHHRHVGHLPAGLSAGQVASGRAWLAGQP